MGRPSISTLRRPRRVSERTIRDPAGRLVTVSLSAGIAVRGREPARIEACLRSLAEQDTRFQEILLVERISRGPSLQKLCKEYGAQYLSLPDPGGPFPKAHTSNVAIRRLHTSASHFVQIDADVIAGPGLVEALLHRLAKGPTDLVSVYPRRLPRLPKSYLEYTFDELLKQSTKDSGDRNAWGMCLTHSFEALHKLKGYNEEFKGWGFEDTDYVSRARRAGYKAGMEDFGPVVLHQWHPTPSRSMYHHNLTVSRAGRANKADWGKV